jgi:hypothetical protein
VTYFTFHLKLIVRLNSVFQKYIRGNYIYIYIYMCVCVCVRVCVCVCVCVCVWVSKWVRRDSSVSVVTRLHVGRPRSRGLMPNVRAALGPTATRPFSAGQTGRGVKLTVRLHLVRRLRKCGVIPPRSHMPSWRTHIYTSSVFPPHPSSLFSSVLSAWWLMQNITSCNA